MILGLILLAQFGGYHPNYATMFNAQQQWIYEQQLYQYQQQEFLRDQGANLPPPLPVEPPQLIQPVLPHPGQPGGAER